MKITVEIPENTICAFMSVVYVGENGWNMKVIPLDTDKIEKAKEEDEQS